MTTIAGAQPDHGDQDRAGHRAQTDAERDERLEDPEGTGEHGVADQADGQGEERARR